MSTFGRTSGRRLRILAAQAVLLWGAWPLLARDKLDLVVMENGDRITGEIKQLSNGVLEVSVPYVDGNLSIQWSKVARIESPQLFLIQTQDGSVYTGPLATEPRANQPPKLHIASLGQGTVTLELSDAVRIDETSDTFLRRLSGEITTGFVYSKGNSASQFNLASDVEYRRERWGAKAAYSSNLAANEGAATSTRNQVNLNGYHLMNRKNYYYGAFGGFLQSSVQGIRLQTTLGGGIGKYFKNTNRFRFSVLGGLAWQDAEYHESVVPVRRQQIYGGAVVTDLRLFIFKRTTLASYLMVAPAFSDPGRVHIETNDSYYLKVFKNFDWNISFYGNWDTRPPDKFAASDYGYSSGIKWTFGYR